MSTIIGYLIAIIICLCLYLCLPRDIWKYYKIALVDRSYLQIKLPVLVILMVMSPTHFASGIAFVMIDPFCFWIANYSDYKRQYKDL